jgi:phospho-N-acetylmuramoyl-pentapeptide-transferase
VLELFFTWVQSGFDLSLPPKAGLMVPFFKEISYPLGVLGFVILTYLVIVGSSNAVNLTDGLDGLAIMPVVMVGLVWVFCLRHRQFSVCALPVPAAYPGLGRADDFLRRHGRCRIGLLVVQHPSGAGFHGRCGCTGAGWSLGTIAVIVRQEIVLAIMGGVFVAEALVGDAAGDLFQVHQETFGNGKRFSRWPRCTTIIEKSGWKETQVVVRFWIITMLLCLVGLTTLKLR